MKKRQLGNSELHVSELSMGSWKYRADEKSHQDWLNLYIYAFENGINLFDTSNNYDGGNAEIFIGKFAKEVGRKNVIIATKCYYSLTGKIEDFGLSKAKINNSIDQSLKRLNVEQIDVFQCHRWDMNTPIEETILAMNELVQNGKIRYWGIGACTAAQLVEASLKSKILNAVSPISHQHAYNMFNRTVEGDVLNYGEKMGIGLLAYSPLSQGVLSGKYSNQMPTNSRAQHAEDKNGMWDFSEEKIGKAAQLLALSKKINVPLTALALRWILRKQQISSVISFAKNESQLEENLKIVSLELSDDNFNEIEEILQNKPYNIYTKNSIE